MRFFQQSVALSVCWLPLLAGAQDGFAYQTGAASSQPLPQATQQVPNNCKNSSRPSHFTLTH